MFLDNGNNVGCPGLATCVTTVHDAISPRMIIIRTVSIKKRPKLLTGFEVINEIIVRSLNAIIALVRRSDFFAVIGTTNAEMIIEMDCNLTTTIRAFMHSYR